MSVQAMSWVFKHSRSRHGERLVLLAIADCANARGEDAWPSMAELCAKTGMSVRSVQDSILRLERLGELVRDRSTGPRRRNRYRMLMDPADSAGSTPQNPHPAESAPPQNPSDDPAESAGSTPQNPREDPAESSIPYKEEPSISTQVPPTEPSDDARHGTKPTSKRGTRIPDDFAVTPEMVAWFNEHCPDVDGRWQTAKFIDYWRGKAGQAATKLDWTATWKNWMRTEQERAGRRSPSGGGTRSSTTDQRVAASQALKTKFAQRNGSTNAGELES